MSALVPDEPVAVQFGAGNIGRGFMGELFWAAGFRTVFVDVNRAVVDALNARGAYEIHHVSNQGDQVTTIDGVSALDAADSDAVADAVAGADLVSTAVGVRVLREVAPALAAGFSKRLDRPCAPPLDVITCENLIGAGRFLRDAVFEHLRSILAYTRGRMPAAEKLDARFGFVEAVVSRMVPLVPESTRLRDPLWVACEPYCRLPVDAAAFRAPVPAIPGLEPVLNILAYQRRKLTMHNMSHATCAYLGYRAGHEFIWQAIEDPAIEAIVRGAVAEAAAALIARFSFDPQEERTYEEDLLARYSNRALADQVRRVAADPLRKLAPDDRLIGAARMCLEESVDPANIILAIRAAIEYDCPQDPAALKLHHMLRTRGRAQVLAEVCGLTEDEPLYRRLL